MNRAAWMLPWLVACGAPVPAVTPLAPCVVRWPAAPHVHTGREGRHATGTVASVEARGLRYEAARFVRDAPLSADERGALVAAVEQGLRARPGVSSLSREGASLVLDFDDGTRGRYRVSFVDASTLIELSVLGAPVDDVDEAARWFFAGAACPAAPGG